MAARVEISGEFIMEAARQPGVTAQLRVVADRVAKNAESLAASEGVEMNTWVEESVRPKGRPQAVVYGDNQEQEWGSARYERYRIMGRAGEGV